jgi:energy-coupling factor transporter ATP-binding protein EcfA2
MRLKRLWISSFKNLRQCEIVFAEAPLLNAVIGSNGSGKSNLIEAILHILINVYFEKSPPFDFDLHFESQGREVMLKARDGRLSIEVEGVTVSSNHFVSELRTGPDQPYYPQLTFVYYSGESRRVRKLMKRYQRHFGNLTRSPETDRFHPLFVESSNQHAQIILLALIAHSEREFLTKLRISNAVGISIVLHSPKYFDPQIHEPKLWNTEGGVRRIIAAIDEIAESQESQRKQSDDPDSSSELAKYTETRTYRFSDAMTGHNIRDLAGRLAKNNDNLYVAFQHLKAREILVSVQYELNGIDSNFDFEELSEGEKQLIAVVGALRLTNKQDNLVLLDEPDTHLNPQWSWEYPSMLADAFPADRKSNSTILIATHDPIMISGMTSEEVWLARAELAERPTFTHPIRNPRGQGIANLICSSEFFGLPSSLDKETQKLLDERLEISLIDDLSDQQRSRLKELNEQLEILQPGVSERDPDYVEFLRQRGHQNE